MMQHDLPDEIEADEQQEQTELFLHEIDGDLFTYCKSSDWKETVPSQVNIVSNNDNFKISKSMCHCVSVDLNMGAGIAVIFKKKYGCVDGLKEQGAKIGEMATLYVPSEEMVVYYLVTKERYFHIPTYESLKSSLSQMKEHMLKHNIVNLAMPQIGIGLDKLEWEKVKEILNELFSDTGIKITVYRYKEGNTQVKSAFRKE